MVNQNFHTIHFQPVRDYFNYYPNQIIMNPGPARVQSSFLTNDYIVRGLNIIQYIVRFIQSTSAYIEEHMGVIRELPKMYHILKAFHEIKQGEDTHNNEQVNDNRRTVEREAVPKLFI